LFTSCGCPSTSEVERKGRERERETDLVIRDDLSLPLCVVAAHPDPSLVLLKEEAEVEVVREKGGSL
jgi:hypothetical protein